MTISAKLSDVGGLEFVVSDPTDTDDVNGFTDIQNSVGGESAKFSGGSAMKANSGLKIGVSQVKFETSLTDLSARSILSSSGVTNPGNVIDDDDSTGTNFSDTNDEIIVDFVSSITAVLKSVGNRGVAGGHNIEISTSTDDITYNVLTSVNYSESKQTVNHGTDTFRYVKFRSTGTTSNANVFSIYAEDTGGDDVTVQLLSTSSLDATSGTTLIGSTVIAATSRDTGSSASVTTFNSVLYLTDAAHYVTLRVVSYGGQFTVPVKLKEITTVKEV